MGGWIGKEKVWYPGNKVTSQFEIQELLCWWAIIFNNSILIDSLDILSSTTINLIPSVRSAVTRIIQGLKRVLLHVSNEQLSQNPFVQGYKCPRDNFSRRLLSKEAFISDVLPQIVFFLLLDITILMDYRMKNCETHYSREM